MALAGQAGRGTIATNMAGRGTDIKLGPGVTAADGLHVLSTERHETIRIDRQLAGRAGREGDPGSCRIFPSLEDEILEVLGPARHEALLNVADAGQTRDWQEFRIASRQDPIGRSWAPSWGEPPDEGVVFYSWANLFAIAMHAVIASRTIAASSDRSLPLVAL